MQAGDAAKGADDWETALTMYKSAELIARKAQSPPILVSAQAKLKQATYYKVESAKLKDYLAVLKQMPDDPAANLGAGRFYCLLRDDWLQGTALMKGPMKSSKWLLPKICKPVVGRSTICSSPPMLGTICCHPLTLH